MVSPTIHERPPRRPHGDLGKTALAAQSAIEALGNATDVRLTFGDHSEIPLPASALDLLVTVLKQLAKGKQVSVVPVEAEMTTQQAADLLLVSRPFLIGLLDAGRIPHRRVGTKRRVLVADVLAYKANEDRRRDACLDDLAAEAQRLGLGY